MANNIKCERKFIVDRPSIIDFANHHILTMIYITQTFLVNSSGDCHVRLENCNNETKYYYCRKNCDRKRGLRLVVEDKEISQEEYNDLIEARAHKTAKVIKKVRFRFEYREQIFNLDFLKEQVENPEYNPDMAEEDENYKVPKYMLDENQAIVMVELFQPEEFVEIPRELLVVKEITNELSYTTKSLAKLLKKQGAKA